MKPRQIAQLAIEAARKSVEEVIAQHVDQFPPERRADFAEWVRELVRQAFAREAK